LISIDEIQRFFLYLVSVRKRQDTDLNRKMQN